MEKNQIEQVANLELTVLKANLRNMIENIIYTDLKYGYDFEPNTEKCLDMLSNNFDDLRSTFDYCSEQLSPYLLSIYTKVSDEFKERTGFEHDIDSPRFTDFTYACNKYDGIEAGEDYDHRD